LAPNSTEVPIKAKNYFKFEEVKHHVDTALMRLTYIQEIKVKVKLSLCLTKYHATKM